MTSDPRMFGIKKWKAHIIWYHNFTEFHLIFDSISSPNVHMKHLLDTLDHHNHGTLPDGTIFPRKTPSPWPRGPLHPRTWPDRWLGRWNATPIFAREVMGRCSGNSLEMVISRYFPTCSQHFPIFPNMFPPFSQHFPNIFPRMIDLGGNLGSGDNAPPARSGKPLPATLKRLA